MSGDADCGSRGADKVIEIRHLRYFVAVAEELHFGRAAQRLHMAQSPLSHQIRQMEQLLGVVLIERDHHVVGLTDAGRVLLEEGRQILRSLEAAVEHTQRAGRGEAGLIRIGYIPEMAAGILPLALKAHRRRFPLLRIETRQGLTGEIADAVAGDQLDLGFVRGAEDGGNLAYEPLVEEELLLARPGTCCEPARPGAGCEPVRPGAGCATARPGADPPATSQPDLPAASQPDPSTASRPDLPTASRPDPSTASRPDLRSTSRPGAEKEAGGPVDLRSVEGEPRIIPDRRSAPGLRRDVDVAYTAAGVSSGPTLEAASPLAMLLLVAAGSGTALIPDSVLRGSPMPGVEVCPLVQRPLTGAGVCWRRGEPSAVTEKFLETARCYRRLGPGGSGSSGP